MLTISNQKPQFNHDCTTCKFLGDFFGHDVYWCGGKGSGSMFDDGTLVARWGDDGPDYSSSPVIAVLPQFRTDPDTGTVNTRDGAYFRDTLLRPNPPEWLQAVVVGLAVTGLRALQASSAELKHEGSDVY